MSREKHLEISCLKLALERRHQRVLSDISCTFKPFELTAVVGPNGAGKSSLLQCLAGVLMPTAGQIELNGQAAEQISAAERARRGAYLPQSETPAWSLSSADLVALGLLPWGRPPDRERRVAAALQLVDAQQFAHRPVTQLSGGELRRVQLARLLVGEAPLLIADEPTSALDIRHQLQLMQNFRRQADAGKTVVLALHDLPLAARYCDRILLLQDGKLRAQGTPEDVLTPALIGDVYGVSCEFRWRDGVADFVPLDLL
ncbi:iron complex transport system ATP-binding protein [Microbulbifer donghaiensis]|uniref:Iron complex transport system ATP-binding protein n=1 Tax=Microbulbifer donghaiensis TaxID=494016 RepID=A0A1M4ZI36_9GAMM|nr:ABC transporter ATP-binding protein [Microbulbifer donghaiensis]SHF17467.1 iron complex transport system ATP-binding protein [Microbulbifer donghaiensis]